ncbi:hypothetical protein GH714_041779 [Hevea brasiliensis]|uniref:AAA+ ATPase domain-containing protein n=1 Tax=Hevea brasiliensis TaxID=3981 RepID=A0A6A6MVM7_HEVBR|nr:hypothetical protein GH714_041779 [Hevea brasiliensis]
MQDSPVCWRKQVDDNLKRLHSLQFGVDLALERRDFSAAHVLGLRLLGFLDSHSLTDVDEALTRPIRREAVSKLDAARQSLIPESDRRAFEQAGRAPGHVFSRKGRPIGWKERLICKTSKVITQTKLTSLYGNNITKANTGSHTSSINSKTNNSDECMVIERAHSYHNHSKGHGLYACIKNEEEERGFGNALGSKRSHEEINSPKNDSAKSPSSNEEANTDASGNGFVTARAKLEMDARQRRGLTGSPSASVSPQSDNINRAMVLEMLCGADGELPEKLRNLEPRLIEHVSNEIMDRDPNVRWDDIAGLEHAKKCVTEMVIWPLLRPDIFKGCRSPGRGLLLFGPPGTGKTMIGKAIAGEAKATFFYISASSLTSKWIGEGEKLVRALFGVASCRQPAVIFVDEIDSLLSQRKSEGEHESSRRLKTQFLIEMEGFDSGATNRPQELDEAARRRLTKRLYIPLPSSEARAWIVRNLLEKDGLFKLSKEEIDTICNLTEGYSGSDMKNLVKDASMGPLREALKQGIEITKLKKEDMRPVTLQDFEKALQEVRPSVSLSELGTYDQWNKQFGSLSL